ncbi:hypothetical protein P5673_017176 [Acropora cervicornis]|uniref:Uncharacterized protein n=1 Tax=Acropora cervicornis TaxID=6130 RepID=A0AAD9QFV9_ACRCE|nr:hypothetical protein P5673_017176 [Acropora cervicornis]
MNSSPPTDHMNADSSCPENTWQQIFKSYSNQHHGFVDSIEQTMVLLKKYELETTTKFSCYKSDKLFRSGGDRVPLDGIPCMTIGSKILDCQHGPDRKKNAKDKIHRQSQTGAITQRMWISEIIV